jgi:predicted alpha/beta superfamily hydrolase
MHDGQNLFEPERSFIPGNHWRLREAADEAVGNRGSEPMIIVGIDNAGAARIDEYTPTLDPQKKAGGRAADHARMLIEELKPLIDQRYRTRAGAVDTAIGGSSLGGLISLYLVLHHPDVFGRAAIMSPSVWWHDRVILSDVAAFDRQPRPRIWLDIGLREGAEAVQGARVLRSALRARGWNGDLAYVEDKRGEHNERAWAGRATRMLEFLFSHPEL